MTPIDPADQTPPLAHRNLPLLLLKAREALLAGFRPIISHFGLTEQQWRIIRTLAEQRERELEPRQICEACQILSPSLTGVLARMEELGLVRRERMAGDQRRVLVRLTPESEAIATRIAPLIEAQYRAVEAHLGTELIGEIYALLDRLLAQNLDAIPTIALPPDEPPAEGEAGSPDSSTASRPPGLDRGAASPGRPTPRRQVRSP